ncbi:MAG: META domain-containing protein [Pseudomonadota bacterium]
MFCIIAFGLPLGFCPDETISGYADPDATYVLEEIAGDPVQARATIRFPEPGLVRGDGPCNSFNAAQTIDYPWIRIEQIVSTRRACPDLDVEMAFFAALQKATLAEVAGDLVLLSRGSEVLLSFRAE